MATSSAAKKRGRAVAFVFVTKACQGPAIGQADPALGPLQGLDVGFFIDTDDDRVEITLLFHFLLLLNCTIYAELPPVLAWLQWIVPALVILLAQPLHLQQWMTRRGHYIATVVGLGVAECVVALLFYFVVEPTVPF